MIDFPAAFFTAFDLAAKLFERLDKEALHVMRLQPLCFRSLHLNAQFVNPCPGHGAICQCPALSGHDVYVIERPIPGVGFLGLEKKQQISQNSNAAIAKLGEIVEWDHSYLTGEGTYCVYRADSPETLREHGVLAGAPVGKITKVLQADR